MSTTTATPRVLTARDRAILTAVDDGRAEVTCSCEPDLFVDGLCCCDQASAHRLATGGLITGATHGRPGSRVRAVLTAVGVRTLASDEHRTLP